MEQFVLHILRCTIFTNLSLGILKMQETSLGSFMKRNYHTCQWYSDWTSGKI